MFKSSCKSLLPFCPPRLTVEKLNAVHWARVPNECLRTTALKLSDFRGDNYENFKITINFVFCFQM